MQDTFIGLRLFRMILHKTSTRPSELSTIPQIVYAYYISQLTYKTSVRIAEFPLVLTIPLVEISLAW